MTQALTLPAASHYTSAKILAIWAAAALPMAFLSWIVTPALASNPDQLPYIRLGMLTLGLIWQFVLVLILLYRETGTLRWSVIRPRLWLNSPRSPRTGQPRSRYWLWLIPLLLLMAIYEMQIGGLIDRLWTFLFPFLAEPPGFSLSAVLDNPSARSQFVGAWGFFALYLVSGIFNTVLGEELLFRGFLLPRMSEAFGKWDWIVNGLLFGLYHLHMPWVILSAAVQGVFLLALPSRRYRTSWFGILAHSGQTVYFTFLILGLVLGLA